MDVFFAKSSSLRLRCVSVGSFWARSWVLLSDVLPLLLGASREGRWALSAPFPPPAAERKWPWLVRVSALGFVFV